MPNKTSIEWTDYSSQLIRYRDAEGKDVWACVKCSPGCAHCYSEAIAERFNRGGPFNQATTRGVTPYFAAHEAKKVIRSKPLSGRRVFVGDMTDVFGEWVPDELLDQMFAVFAMRPDVTFQVLTKRAERMARYFNERDSHLAMTRQFVNFREYTEPVGPWPLPNVHLGTSVEDQATADARIPHLLKIPAKVRFLSMEPLLGPVDLSDHFGVWVGCFGCGGVFPHDKEGSCPDCKSDDNAITIVGQEDLQKFIDGQPCDYDTTQKSGPRIDWVIVGGESGSGARPFDLGWARSIRDQCQVARVAVFIKQLGAVPMDDSVYGERKTAVVLRDKKGGDWSEWSPDLRVREFPTIAEASS